MTMIYLNVNENIKATIEDNLSASFTDKLEPIKEISAFIIEEDEALCTQIKEQTNAPIFLITDSCGSNDDDFTLISRPIKLAALLELITGKIKTFEQNKDAEIKIGTLIFKPHEREINHVKLTEKETEVLRYLAKQGELGATREELLTTIWGYNPEVDTHTLETHIYKLRKKIETDPNEPKLLVTNGLGGYKLVL